MLKLANNIKKIIIQPNALVGLCIVLAVFSKHELSGIVVYLALLTVFVVTIRSGREKEII